MLQYINTQKIGYRKRKEKKKKKKKEEEEKPAKVYE
jgi:hypothetical protein